MRSLAAVVTLALVAACLTSPSPRTAALGDEQRGERARLRATDGHSYVGELLAVDDSTVYLLVRDRVSVARTADVDSLNSASVRVARLRDATWHSPKTRTRVQLASRFPYGIVPAAMERLLAASRQTAPDTVRVEPR